jgi:hypothetical protein
LFSATNCANVHIPKMTVRDAVAIETSRRFRAQPVEGLPLCAG